MPGFGVTVRAAIALVASPFIAALVVRIADPMLEMMKSATIVQESGTPEAITRTLTFVEAATDNLLLVLVVSVVVLWLTRSYLNSEVQIR